MGLFSKIGGVAGSFVTDRIANTKTAFQLIVNDFKRAIRRLKFAFLAISAATVVFGIIAKTGNLIVNCCMLGLLVLYMIFDAFINKKEHPNASRRVRFVYAWSKILLNAAALASSIYSLYTGAENVNPLSIVLATLSMMLFVLKVLVEICFDIFVSKWALLKSGMILDAKEHPNTSGKLFSPLIGDAEEAKVKDSIADRIAKRKSEK